jgi:hypothetical protein
MGRLGNRSIAGQGTKGTISAIPVCQTIAEIVYGPPEKPLPVEAPLKAQLAWKADRGRKACMQGASNSQGLKHTAQLTQQHCSGIFLCIKPTHL